MLNRKNRNARYDFEKIAAAKSSKFPNSYDEYEYLIGQNIGFSGEDI